MPQPAANAVGASWSALVTASCLVSVIVLALSPSSVWAQGTIEGRVTLSQEKAAPVQIKRYDIVSKRGVVSTNPYVAVVYLEGSFPVSGPLPVKEMIQKDFMFDPALMPARTGTKVEFPNLDDAYHDVFSYSKAKRFDLGRYLRDETPVPFVVFDKPGLVTLRCDIHEHMRAVVLVLDTPHFVITGTDGKFRLTGLPAGKYKLKAWLDSKKTLEQDVEVRNKATVKVNFP
jgi:hypothetical protein